MKRTLRCPRVVRDLLALLPAEWAAAADASNLREPPTEFIGTRGDKRIADLCWLAGRRYARLDLRDRAAQYPERNNRMSALARLTFAESYVDAIRVLGDVCEWLDFGDADEARLYQCYLDWFHAVEPRFRPRDWDPERERKLEELMVEQSILERNNERWLQRYRREALAEGRRDGLADGRRDGLAHERALLVRQAARRFGADTGRRLEALLRAVEDPDRLERVGDLIVDSETGEQLLGGLDGAGVNSS